MLLSFMKFTALCPCDIFIFTYLHFYWELGKCKNHYFFTMIFRSIFLFCVQKHARRVYEILRLRNTDMSDEEKAREFRLEVKKRLFGPYRVGVFTFVNLNYYQLLEH